LDGLPTTIDGGYLISTTPKECQYRFSMAHSERMALTLPFYFRPWSPSKRMREDRNGFIAVFALFVCLWRVCGLKKEFEQLQLFPTKIHSSPDILFIWIQNRAFVV
jgi:hypothetical protein